MFNSSNTLVRQFLTHTDSEGKSSGNVGLQDPTYMGFTVKFSYFNDEARDETGRTHPNQIMSGLLLPEDRLESAIGYLRRAGKPERAEYIKQFREELQAIERDKPWYFQSITGLNELLKRPTNGSNFRGKDKVLTFECLESIDMQMSFLSDLYRKGSFEFEYMRELLPDFKKFFSMTIIVAEIRNMKMLEDEINALLSNVNDGFRAHTLGIMDPREDAVNAAVNERFKNDLTTQEVSWDLKTYVDYYERYKEEITTKSAQVEKGYNNAVEAYDNLFTDKKGDDIKGVSASSVPPPDTTSVSSKTIDDNAKSEPGITKKAVQPAGKKEIVGDANYLNKLQSRLSAIITKADNLMTFYVFKLDWCEFVFDEHPWLETVTNAKPDTPATMKFQIKVGGVTEMNQYGFKEWVLADADSASGSNTNTVLGKFNEKMKNWNAWHNPKTINYGEYSDKLERALSSDGKTAKERALGNETAVDNTWLAKAKRLSKAGDDIIQKYGPDIKKNIDKIAPELGKDIDKAMDDANKAKLKVDKTLVAPYNYSVGIDLSDPMSVVDAIVDLNSNIQDAKGFPKKLSANRFDNVYKAVSASSIIKKDGDDISASYTRVDEKSGAAFKNVDFRNDASAKKKDDLSWKSVYFKSSPSLDKKGEMGISPLTFNEVEPQKNITPLTLSKTEPQTNITPLTFDKPTVSEGITPLTLDQPKILGDITPLTFDIPAISEGITPSPLVGAGFNGVVSPKNIGLVGAERAELTISPKNIYGD